MIICSNYVNGKLNEKKHKINNDLIVKTVLLNIFYPNITWKKTKSINKKWSLFLLNQWFRWRPMHFCSRLSKNLRFSDKIRYYLLYWFFQNILSLSRYLFLGTTLMEYLGTTLMETRVCNLYWGNTGCGPHRVVIKTKLKFGAMFSSKMNFKIAYCIHELRALVPLEIHEIMILPHCGQIRASFSSLENSWMWVYFLTECSWNKFEYVLWDFIGFESQACIF